MNYFDHTEGRIDDPLRIVAATAMVAGGLNMARKVIYKSKSCPS
jgi:hypothetical protein